MADSLYELLASNLSQPIGSISANSSPIVGKYLTRLTTLPVSALSSTEPQSLNQSSHSNVLQLQALASRSHKSTVASVGHLLTLTEALPGVAASVSELRDAIPQLDQQAVEFSTLYSKSREENPTLDRRKNAMMLARQADNVSEILELPSLLSTSIASAGASSSTGANYSQALDLFAHIKRLQILYPDSDLVRSVVSEAETAMRDMTTHLITSLRAQNIRLAAAIRTIGFLRRVAPELGDPKAPSSEGVYGSLFLTARLANLISMLEALSPLRDLADQETARRVAQKSDLPEQTRRPSATMGYVNQGQQTERYLKRYIEIFREQTFAAVSMFKNVFPVSANESNEKDDGGAKSNLPSALASFPMHVVGILVETLRKYLPNVTEPQARESLLTQVLYAAGSLGRLGADFSLVLALLEEDLTEVGDERAAADTISPEANGDDDEKNLESEPPEWVTAIEKHRVQAARLEALTAGQDGNKRSGEVSVK